MGRKVTKIINNKERKEIITDYLHLKFLPKLENTRGNKAHYILNLTQDKVFHDEVVLPTTVIHSYLKLDPKWSELFEGIK